MACAGLVFKMAGSDSDSLRQPGSFVFFAQFFIGILCFCGGLYAKNTHSGTFRCNRKGLEGPRSMFFSEKGLSVKVFSICIFVFFVIVVVYMFCFFMEIYKPKIPVRGPPDVTERDRECHIEGSSKKRAQG